MDEKRFDEWNEQAKILHDKDRQRDFKEREVWWYCAGENIGHEINGKGPFFLRPILIIRKYGSQSFFGVPLSSRIAGGRWFAEILVRGEKSCVLLSQAGSFSVNRLHGRICRLSPAEFDVICAKLQELLFKITPEKSSTPTFKDEVDDCNAIDF